MKNTFEIIYKQIEELRSSFRIAKADQNTEVMEQIRAEIKAVDDSIEAKGAAFAMMYDFYEDSQQRGNEHIDISECYDYRDEAALIATFRECGIDTFTFSSRWSGAVESAWDFIRNGCTLMGMVEINSKSRNWDDDGYEKCHAYLFKVN